MAAHLLRSVASGLRNQLRGKAVLATTAARRFESSGSAEEWREPANEATKAANKFVGTNNNGDSGPLIDLSPTPANWELLNNLQSSSYIDYKQLILNQRAKALDPPPPGLFNVSA